MRLNEAVNIGENIDEFTIQEEWEDGEVIDKYTLIKKSGLGSARSNRPAEYKDTWLVQSCGWFYPAKIISNSMTNDKIVRVYKQDRTKDKKEAWEKVIKYHNELI